jgi:hypothetical protein
MPYLFRAFAVAVLLAAPMAGQARGSSGSSHAVFGYTTSRGTYVAPAYASNPNAMQRDNYTARGNVNPYTGAVGTRAPTR